MKKVIFWLILIVVMVFSLLPVEHLPPIAFNWWDKTQHILSFFILGALGFTTYPKNSVQLAFGLICYGVLIEVFQSLSGWRDGEILDWVADIIGVTCAFTAYFFYNRFTNQRHIHIL